MTLLTTLLTVCLAANAMAMASASGAAGQAGRRKLPAGHGGAAAAPLPVAADGAPASVEGDQKMGVEVEVVEQQFRPRLQQVLATHRVVQTIPVLVRQMLPAPPPTWILATLTGRSSQEKITMAVTVGNDDFNVGGFSNASGTWFAFRRFQGLLQGSTTLPGSEDHASLIGDRMNLPSYDISKETVLQAVRFLSTYRLAPAGDNDGNLRISLGRLIVVVAEAARFKSVYNAVAQELLQQQQQTRSTELLVRWAELSMALMTWRCSKEPLGLLQEAPRSA